jgi:glycosyltransferase involved in cell wall biosynthesis
MRIAVLGIKRVPATGGADRVVEQLLEYGSRSHEYFVYVQRDTHEERVGDPNVHFVSIPTVGGKHAGPFVYFFLSAMHCLIKGRYDLAHVHNSDFGVFCAVLRLKRGMPVVGTFHGDPYLRRKWGWFARWYLRLSERCFVQWCDRLTSVSRSKRSARGWWRSRTVTHIPNGMDSFWNRPVARRFAFEAYGLRPGDYVLFAAGRIDATKGLHHLLEAYSNTGFGGRLLVVGDFSHDAEYAGEVRQACARDGRVVVHDGLLDRDRLVDVVRNCRACVFPSEVEAMSMMLLELISAKRPVVCSDIPENVDVVGASYPYLYAARDAVALGNRLDACLNNPDGDELAGALYARCVARFGWPDITARYEAIYHELAAVSHRGARAAVGAGGAIH